MRVFVASIFTALVLVWAAGVAQAGNAAAPGPSAGATLGVCTGPCVLGPGFTAVDGVAEYRVLQAGESLTVTAEDACIVGDTFELLAKRFQASGTDTTNGTTVAGCTCDYTALIVDDASVTINGSGPARVRLKAISLPGGAPAQAYISFSAGTVLQTAGEDACP